MRISCLLGTYPTLPLEKPIFGAHDGERYIRKYLLLGRPGPPCALELSLLRLLNNVRTAYVSSRNLLSTSLRKTPHLQWGVCVQKFPSGQSGAPV